MSTTERPLRKDAERNRRRILEAAAEVFGERGLGATLDAVAERAGVGVGTVYRRFPDKEALVDALFEERIDEVRRIALEAAGIADPWAALTTFFERALEMHCHDRALKELMFSTAHGRDRVAHAREQIKPVVGTLVERAKASEEFGPGAKFYFLLHPPLLDEMGLPAALRFFLFQPRAAYTALGLLVASGMLAGVYPSWRAASLPLATTLRREAIA